MFEEVKAVVARLTYTLELLLEQGPTFRSSPVQPPFPSAKCAPFGHLQRVEEALQLLL